MKYLGPHVHHGRGDEPSRLTMAFTTPKGALREVAITRGQALKTIYELAGMLVTLDRGGEHAD